MTITSQTDSQEKAHGKVGLSNILTIYVLTGTVQLTKLADCDNSISHASDVIGVE